MVSRDLHVQGRTGIAQILGDQHGAFLADQEGSLGNMLIQATAQMAAGMAEAHRECVAAHIVWTDRQVANFQSLDAMHVETLVKNAAVFCDRAALSRGHAASPEGVPSGLDMAFDFFVSTANGTLSLLLTPFLNALNVLLAIVQGVSRLVLVRIEHSGRRGLAWLHGMGP